MFMTLGNWVLRTAARHHARAHCGAAALAAAAALIVFTAGCGGGGGGGGNPNNQGFATVIGRLVNSITGTGVGGARVTFGQQGAAGFAETTSLPDGRFNLRVPAPSGASVVRIEANGYYGIAQYNGQTFRLVADGVAVPAAAANQTYDVGTIRLYSLDGPPPPPRL